MHDLTLLRRVLLFVGGDLTFCRTEKVDIRPNGKIQRVDHDVGQLGLDLWCPLTEDRILLLIRSP